MNDLTGQRFGRLSVIRATDERRHRHIVWECKCDCGNTVYVVTGSLLNGVSQSCGCLRKESKTRDLVGRRFGKLTVMRPTEIRKKSGAVVWECLCDCGKTALVETGNLTGGGTSSCGCSTRPDLTGQRFGKLTVLRCTPARKQGSVLWACQCDCGNIVLVKANDLTKGQTKSCGCLRKRKKVAESSALIPKE